MSWHVPCDAEIDFALELFRELVEPTLAKLEKLLEERMLCKDDEVEGNTKRRYLAVGASRNGIWRNDFCRYVSSSFHQRGAELTALRRYLTFVRNAFAGTPTLIRFDFTEEEFLKSCETSDIL